MIKEINLVYVAIEDALEKVESKVSITCLLRAIIVCEGYFKNLNEGEA